MPDTQILRKLDNMERKADERQDRQEERHVEVCQRLTTLETRAETVHPLHRCPEVKTLMAEREDAKKTGRIKKCIDYGVKAAGLALAAVLGAKYGS